MYDQTKNTCICASATFNCPLPPTKSNSPLPTVDRLGGALHTKHTCARNWTCGWLMIGHGLLRIHGDRVYSFHQLSSRDISFSKKLLQMQPAQCGVTAQKIGGETSNPPQQIAKPNLSLPTHSVGHGMTLRCVWPTPCTHRTMRR